MKLKPELVPKPLWGISAYRMLKRGKAWKQIRQDALKVAHARCSVCGTSTGPLSCHEKWVYDDSKGIAMLTGFEIHCPDCDLVTHFGRAIQHGQGERAFAQLCLVNRIARGKAEELYAKAAAEWRVRNVKAWRVEVKRELLGEYPQLQCLSGVQAVPTREG